MIVGTGNGLIVIVTDEVAAPVQGAFDGADNVSVTLPASRSLSVNV